MIEMLVRPKTAEKRPWEMFFVGLLYASVALLLVSFVDLGLGKYSGILVVTFTVICSFPFVYYIIKLEEGKDIEISEEGRLIRQHSKAVWALMWLFLGFIVAFSFWYLALPTYTAQSFNAQIDVFCSINSQNNFCTAVHNQAQTMTGNVAKTDVTLSIFANNVYVLIFTILFSLAFGAGAIFVLAWNASVIAAAIGIFAKGNMLNLPLGWARYMIHGIPEIAAYFIGAIAGGILSVAVIRRDTRGDKLWKILQDSLILIIIAVLILVFAALVEVFITPVLF